MRNLDSIKPRISTKYTPAYVFWCARMHLDELNRQHTAAMQRASEVADEIVQCEHYLAALETGEIPK